jgi:hypothetical protein
MSTRNYLYGLLVALSITRSAESAEETVTLYAEVEEILTRTNDFCEKGYTEEADNMARQTTNQLITTLADRIAAPPEIDAMIDVHLKTELYYAFNTQWGTGKVRNHRIVYDFLSHLDKSIAREAHQKEHLSKITMLSLAAQEYFWNEKSTINDLRNRVKRELRYGPFKQTGNKLDISNVVYLDEDSLERIANESISDMVFGKLRTLLCGFKMKSLGATYAAIFDHLTTVLSSVAETALPLELEAETIAPLGLFTSVALKPMPSLGDGMCGEHSCFIPTDGHPESIQEGNGRYKIYRAILDHAADSETKRLYFLASKHMDGMGFVTLISNKIAELRLIDSEQADALQAKLDTYQTFLVDKQAENEALLAQSKKDLVVHVTQLPTLEASLTSFHAFLNMPDQLAMGAHAKNFKNIIDEIMLLRASNTELNRLLETIDAEILRLDNEAKVAETKAKLAVVTARSETEAAFKLAQAEFEQCKKSNEALVKEHKELFATIQQLAHFIKTVTTTEAAMQAARTALALNEEKIKAFELRNPEFIKDIGQKEIAMMSLHQKYGTLAENHTDRDAKQAEKYALIGNTLKDFISVNMLPGRSEHAFSIDALCTVGYANFINGVCQEICTTTANHAEAKVIRMLWDNFDSKKEALNRQTDQLLLSQRLEIAATLPVFPTELSPDSLKSEMEALALSEGELCGWLPCDAPYTQLWAIINNLNIFVFSSEETYGRTPLDVMTRLKDRPYDSVTMPYPVETTGKHLATVILTSPTSKNIFLDKSPAHYDKFILPGDYAAIAQEIRHVALTKLEDRYASYP